VGVVDHRRSGARRGQILPPFESPSTRFANFSRHGPEAKKRGYSDGHFSFNIPAAVRSSRAKHRDVEMQFLADRRAGLRGECRGTRFKSGVLEVPIEKRNVAEVLNLTVRRHLVFFAASKDYYPKLRISR